MGLPRSSLFWLLLQLFICRTFQDRNLTATEIITPILISADVTVIVTLGTGQSSPTAFPVSILETSVYTTGILGPTYSAIRRHSTVSQGEASNSSTFGPGTSLECSDAAQVHVSSRTSNTFVANLQITNDTISADDSDEDEESPPRRSRPRSIADNSTTSDDDSRRGDDTKQDVPDISARWINHQRKRYTRKRLWEPNGEDDPIRSSRASPLPRAGVAAMAAGALYLTTLEAERRRKRPKIHESVGPPAPIPCEPYDIVLQPETRPISQEQLVAEVKGIYAGLVMVEAKCIEVDKTKALLASSGSSEKLSNEQWQALIALHRMLLYEHHDFFLATQHPSASPALRRLASKYAMPARMWRHGIYSLLELLRQYLPDSRDHMLAFIYLAYQMMALLHETVPAFEDTWKEALGDLARYRMAIEDEDIEDRKVWANVARYWYSECARRSPKTGRLYHHLAILTRRSIFKGLSLFSKSLCVAAPFSSARASILSVFHPIFEGQSTHLDEDTELSAPELAFVKIHGYLLRQELDDFETQSQQFLALINIHIDQQAEQFLEDGYHISIANSAAVLGYGSSDNPLMCDLKDIIEDSASSHEAIRYEAQFQAARRIAHATLNAFLLRKEDPNVLAGIHAALVFMHFMVSHPWSAHLVRIDFPWTALADFLNNLLREYNTSDGIIENETSPMSRGDGARPLPEDYALRGLLWADTYFPLEWFPDEIEDHAQMLCTPRMTADRKERILWLADRISQKLPSRLLYEAASFNPIRAEINNRRFSAPRSLDSSHQVWEETGLPGMSPHASNSSKPIYMKLLGSLASRSRDDDFNLDGIRATLGLPIDTLGQQTRYISSQDQLSSSSPATPCKNYHETLDTWLSDLVHLDMVRDGNAEPMEAQEAELDQLNLSTEKVIPFISNKLPVDVIVFSQTGDGHQDDEEDPDRNSESNHDSDREGDKEHERQKMEEAEKLSIVKSRAKPTTFTLTSPLSAGKQYTLIEPKPSLVDYESLREKVKLELPSQFPTPSSSSSSPGKPYACHHCNKAFSRASDMNKHIKYHTRPITCTVEGCDYTCGRQKDLSRHQHGVHKDFFGEEEFPCPFEECKKAGVKFSRRDNLGRYLKKRHGGAKGENEENEDNGGV